MLLEQLTWPEVKNIKFDRVVVLLPLGSFEQHGRHLPFTTDTDIVAAIARRIEKERSDRVLYLPPMWTGHSPHHLAFPGTLSVNQEHYMGVITDLCRSIVSMGGRRIFLLNSHGGNDVPVRAALRQLKTNLSGVSGLHIVFASYWMIAAQSIREIRESERGGLGHACELETSIMLHLHPSRVRMEKARRDGPEFSSDYRKGDMQSPPPVYCVNEFDEISETGVVGHPDLASAEKGEKFFDAIVRDVLNFIDDFLKW